MKELFKWLSKVLVTAIIWVFVLSITWNGRTLFSYANESLVQNELVQTIDEELADLWSKIKDTARVTFSDRQEEDEKA